MSFKYNDPDEDVVWVQIPKHEKPTKGPGSEFVKGIKSELSHYNVKQIQVAFVVIQNDKAKA